MLDVGANIDCKPENLQQFAIMGEIYFRTIFGHNGGQDTISVGAVPFSSAPPETAATLPISTEDFTSVGPITMIFDAEGNRLNTPRTLLKPDGAGPRFARVMA